MVCNGPNDPHNESEHMDAQDLRWIRFRKAQQRIDDMCLDSVPHLQAERGARFEKETLVPKMRAIFEGMDWHPIDPGYCVQRRLEAARGDVVLVVFGQEADLRNSRWQCVMDQLHVAAQHGELEPFDNIECAFAPMYKGEYLPDLDGATTFRLVWHRDRALAAGTSRPIGDKEVEGIRNGDRTLLL